MITYGFELEFRNVGLANATPTTDVNNLPSLGVGEKLFCISLAGNNLYDITPDMSLVYENKLFYCLEIISSQPSQNIGDNIIFNGIIAFINHLRENIIETDYFNLGAQLQLNENRSINLGIYTLTALYNVDIYPNGILFGSFDRIGVEVVRAPIPNPPIVNPQLTFGFDAFIIPQNERPLLQSLLIKRFYDHFNFLPNSDVNIAQNLFLNRSLRNQINNNMYPFDNGSFTRLATIAFNRTNINQETLESNANFINDYGCLEFLKFYLASALGDGNAALGNKGYMNLLLRTAFKGMIKIQDQYSCSIYSQYIHECLTNNNIPFRNLGKNEMIWNGDPSHITNNLQESYRQLILYDGMPAEINQYIYNFLSLIIYPGAEHGKSVDLYTIYENYRTNFRNIYRANMRCTQGQASHQVAKSQEMAVTNDWLSPVPFSLMNDPMGFLSRKENGNPFNQPYIVEIRNFGGYLSDRYNCAMLLNDAFINRCVQEVNTGLNGW